jgi:predicted nucleotidyltransferase
MTDVERLRKAIGDAIVQAALDALDGQDVDLVTPACTAIVDEWNLAQIPPEGGSSYGHWRDDCDDVIAAIIDVARGK